MKKNQQGIALVVAMLILAITTILASQIFYQQQIVIRRTANQLQAQQLYQLLLSSEAWVKIILKEDAVKNKFDYLGDNWAQAISPFDAENAKIKISVIDSQSCFNINNLVLNGKVQKEQIKILQNMMMQLQLNPELVWTLADWLDADDEPYPAGAEWETYSRLTPSYQPANFRITELNELYAVSGWSTAVINKLTPYICALPPAPQFTNNGSGRFFKDSKNSLININTASEVLLRSLSSEMRNVNLMNILNYRKVKGYSSIAEFIKQLDSDNPKKPKVSMSLNQGLLSIDSHYFLLEYHGWLDQFEQSYHSLIYRDDKNGKKILNTLYRSQYY